MTGINEDNTPDVDLDVDTSTDRPRPVQVQVTTHVLLSDGQVVRVRERCTVDLLEASREGIDTLFRSVRRRLVRACNLAGAQAQDVFNGK